MEKEERPQRVSEHNPLFFRGLCVSHALVEGSRALDVIGVGQAAQSGRIILLLSVAVVPRVLCQVRNCHKLPAARRTHAGVSGGGGRGAMKFSREMSRQEVFERNTACTHVQRDAGRVSYL